jgi:hypothetical protein
MGMSRCRFCSGKLSVWQTWVRCPHCGELYPENGRTCSHCLEVAHKDGDCGICGHPHPNKIAHCRGCGQVLSRARLVVTVVDEESSVVRQPPCPKCRHPGPVDVREGRGCLDVFFFALTMVLVLYKCAAMTGH